MFLSVHRIFLIFYALTSLIIGLFAFIFSLCVAEHKRSRLVGSLLSLVLLGLGSFSLAIGLGFGEKTMLNRISHYGKVEYYSSLGQSSVTNSQHIVSKIYLHQRNKRHLIKNQVDECLMINAVRRFFLWLLIYFSTTSLLIFPSVLM
jgi:hypothetical protein